MFVVCSFAVFMPNGRDLRTTNLTSWFVLDFKPPHSANIHVVQPVSQE